MEALGNPKARTQSTVYSGSQAAQQYMQMPGLPLGTRGGMLIEHTFPVDGEYEVTDQRPRRRRLRLGRDGSVHADRHRGWRACIPGRRSAARRTSRPSTWSRRWAWARSTQRFRNIRVKVPAGRHSVGVTYKQKTAAEHNEVLHGFVPVAGMGQMVNGNSGGPRISQRGDQGAAEPLPGQRDAEPAQALRLQAGKRRAGRPRARSRSWARWPSAPSGVRSRMRISPARWRSTRKAASRAPSTTASRRA